MIMLACPARARALPARLVTASAKLLAARCAPASSAARQLGIARTRCVDGPRAARWGSEGGVAERRDPHFLR